MNRFLHKCLLVLAGLFFLTINARAETTSEVLSACRGVSVASAEGDMVDVPPTYAGGLCWGMFAVLQANSKHVDRVTKKSLYGICPPKESRRTQFIAIFMKYADSHPERWHEDFFPVALSAIRGAFPCSP